MYESDEELESSHIVLKNVLWIVVVWTDAAPLRKRESQTEPLHGRRSSATLSKYLNYTIWKFGNLNEKER